MTGPSDMMLRGLSRGRCRQATGIRWVASCQKGLVRGNLDCAEVRANAHEGAPSPVCGCRKRLSARRYRLE